MSNITFVYPNRAREIARDANANIIGLHRVLWTDNTNLPLENCLTEVFPDTARTADFASYTDKRCSFAISLNALPYRTIGSCALANHNLTTSAKIRFTVYNEPAITYASGSISLTGTNGSATLTTEKLLDTTGWVAGITKLKLYAISCNRNHPKTGSYIEGTFTSYNTGTKLLQINVTNRVQVGGDLNDYTVWYVGFSKQDGRRECEQRNAPLWLDAWERIYQSSSDQLSWNSNNFWLGTIEEEQRNEFTHLILRFFDRKDLAGSQPEGTHIHIDIDDSQTPQIWSNGIYNPNYQPFIEFGYVMFGQAWTATHNPEYGAIKFAHEDTSEKQESDSGQEFWKEKQKRRTVSVSFNLLDKTEAFGRIYDAQRSQGLSRPIAFAFSKERIDDYYYAQTFIGRLTQLDPIGQPHYGFFDATINLREML